MGYHWGRAVTSAVITLAIAIGYGIWVTTNGPAVGDTAGWAIATLVLFAVVVAAHIVVLILYHMGFAFALAVHRRSAEGVEEDVEAAVVEDEMVRFAELRATRVAAVCSAIGTIAMLVALAFDAPIPIALGCLAAGALLGTAIEPFVRAYNIGGGASRA